MPMLPLAQRPLPGVSVHLRNPFAEVFGQERWRLRGSDPLANAIWRKSTAIVGETVGRDLRP